MFGPYGNARAGQGTFNTFKGFTGQYNDSLTGLDYYISRYYDPVAGVFLSADPVQGNLAGMNPYGYVGGNPETYADPTGQMDVNFERDLGPGGDVGVMDPSPNGEGELGAGSIPQAFHNAFSDSTSLDPTASAGETTYSYDPASDSITVTTNTPGGDLSTQTLWQSSGLAYTQALAQLNQLLASAGGSVINSSVLAKNGISDLLPNSAGPQTQTGGGGQGNRPPVRTASPSGFCSFTPDTVVTMDHGKEAIGKLQVGDKVLAYNPKTHKMENEPVLHVWKHTDKDLVDLTISTTRSAQHGKPATRTSEVLHTTSEHPFFTTEQGFVAAGKVKIGMHVLRADGSVGVITGWKVVPGTKVMYNLEVAQDHTFTVGQGQWVVHNECNRERLRSNLAETGTLLNGQQAHHIIPCELETDPLVQRAGLDINSADNGIGLPTTAEMSYADNLPLHSGRHPAYTRAVGRLLNNAYDDLAEEYGNFNNVPGTAAQEALTGIIARVKNAITDTGSTCGINNVPLE